MEQVYRIGIDKGIEQVFEMKKEKQRAEIETGTEKEQRIGKQDRNAEKGTAGHGIPATRYQPHQDTDTHKRQGNGSHKGTEKAGYEQLSLSFNGRYAFCGCGRALQEAGDMADVVAGYLAGFYKR